MSSQEYFQPELVTIPLLPLKEFLQETVAFIFSTCTHVEKLTPHLHFFTLSLSNGLRELCVLLFKLFSSPDQRESVKISGEIRILYILPIHVESFL
jgi:hypothetical protein